MASSLMPPILNPSSLYKEEAKRDATRIRIYNGVLQQIYNKIKAIARIPGNEKTLWYVVPEFLPGVPRFDIGDAILYIVWNLRNSGYSVEYTHPNLLFVTWRSHDERYREVESPWSQVLHTVKSQKHTDTYKPTLYVDTPKHEKPNDIVKRKTILKKTVEFKPSLTLSPLPHHASSPTIAKLPGQLTENHISFV